jgi:hypothetical protein
MSALTLGAALTVLTLIFWSGPARVTDSFKLPLADAPAHMNFCLGGFEDRKQIVNESTLENPFRQTTLLSCQIDGGTPVVMPDLPRPVAKRTVLA